MPSAVLCLQTQEPRWFNRESGSYPLQRVTKPFPCQISVSPQSCCRWEVPLPASSIPCPQEPILTVSPVQMCHIHLRADDTSHSQVVHLLLSVCCRLSRLTESCEHPSDLICLPTSSPVSQAMLSQNHLPKGIQMYVSTSFPMQPS